MVVVLYGTLAIINRVTRLVVTYFYSVFSQCIFLKVSFPFSPKSQQLLSRKEVGYSSFNMLTFCDKMPHLWDLPLEVFHQQW